MSTLSTVAGTLDIADVKLKALNGQYLSEAKQNNIYAETAALGAGYLSSFGPLGAVASLVTASGAALTEEDLIQEDKAKLEANITPRNILGLTGDLISAAGNGLQALSAIGNLDPVFAPVAKDAEGIAKLLEFTGLALSAPEYVEDVLHTAGKVWLSEASSFMSDFVGSILDTNIPKAISDDVSAISNDIKNSLSQPQVSKSLASYIPDIEKNVTDLLSTTANKADQIVMAPTNVVINALGSGANIDFSVQNDAFLDQFMSLAFNLNNDNSVSEKTINSQGNLKDLSLEPNGTEVDSYYSGTDDSASPTKQAFDFIDGSSAFVYYGQNDASVTNYFSDFNGSGIRTEQDVEQANGTSVISLYNEDGSYTRTHYSGSEGSGDVISTNSSSQTTSTPSSSSVTPSNTTSTSTPMPSGKSVGGSSTVPAGTNNTQEPSSGITSLTGQQLYPVRAANVGKGNSIQSGYPDIKTLAQAISGTGGYSYSQSTAIGVDRSYGSNQPAPMAITDRTT